MKFPYTYESLLTSLVSEIPQGSILGGLGAECIWTTLIRRLIFPVIHKMFSLVVLWIYREKWTNFYSEQSKGGNSGLYSQCLKP